MFNSIASIVYSDVQDNEHSVAIYVTEMVTAVAGHTIIGETSEGETVKIPMDWIKSITVNDDEDDIQEFTMHIMIAKKDKAIYRLSQRVVAEMSAICDIAPDSLESVLEQMTEQVTDLIKMEKRN